MSITITGLIEVPTLHPEKTELSEQDYARLIGALTFLGVTDIDITVNPDDS